MCIYENLNDLIINRFAIDYVTTGYFMMIPFGLGSVFALIFGHFLKVKPNTRRTLILMASMVVTIGLIALYSLPNNQSASDVNTLDFIVIVGFLIFLSMMTATTYTVLGSSTSLLSDKKRLGTAWGVIGVAIGLGEAISSMINGLV
jgi:ABC-type nitrate/sulfonate/bicarbonate transport system permease component